MHYHIEAPIHTSLPRDQYHSPYNFHTCPFQEIHHVSAVSNSMILRMWKHVQPLARYGHEHSGRTRMIIDSPPLSMEASSLAHQQQSRCVTLATCDVFNNEYDRYLHSGGSLLNLNLKVMYFQSNRNRQKRRYISQN